MPPRVAFYCLAVLAATTFDHAVAQPTMSEGEFRREYRGGVRKLKEAVRRGRFVVRETTGSNQMTSEQWGADDRGAIFVRIDALSGPSKGQFGMEGIAYRPEGGFHFVNRGASGPQAWTLGYAAPGLESRERANVDFLVYGGAHILSAFCILGCDLEDAINSSICRIERIAPRETQEGLLVDVDLKLLRESDSPPWLAMHFSKVTVTFSPDEDWALREYVAECWPSKVEARADADTRYEQTQEVTRVDGRIVPLKTTWRSVVTRLDKPPSELTQTIEFLEWEFGAVDESRFSLASFGMSDEALAPVLPSPRWSARPVMFLPALGAALCATALAAKAARRFGRRKVGSPAS